MKILESAENYLEAILVIQKEKGAVRAIDIAHHLGYSKPSVSVAMKQLETNGFIHRNADNHITLTPDGMDIATSIFERHAVLSKLFMLLGVSEETAKEDACKIEHHISDETFECIKKHYQTYAK
jgi:Mn-dependent DtxR family transcriptional regulator